MVFHARARQHLTRRLLKFPNLAAAAATALLAAALGPGCTRGPAPRTAVEQAAALTPEVEQAVGLRFRTPPRIERRSRADVRAAVAASLARPGARAVIAAQQAAYRRLGLIPDTLDLAVLDARVLDEQVAGYYDPQAKTIYLIDDADSAATTAALRHELVRALQDQQRSAVLAGQRVTDADEEAAERAALEGQAMWVQLGSGRDLASRLPGGWDRVRQEIRANADRSPQLAAAPLVVRENALFPYLSGAELARQVAAAGRLDSLALYVPVATREVLHPEAYLARRAAGRRAGTPQDKAPRLAEVVLPPPRPGAVTASNVLGEFDTRLFLYQHTDDLATAARAAAGLAGDRWAVVRTGGGDAFAWLTVWDTGTDAAEFFQAAGDAVAKRYEGARADSGAGPNAKAGAGANTKTYAAAARDGGRVVRVRALDVAGRPAVLYVDAPSAAELDVVDPARATLRP